ncbi:membrane protein [Agaricicola taiwanensis]|uniref:Membrane protein n=1 Tax=Agaricicola taiwanensis TaxID=591372 RepID=A0A8J2VM55_9RHOB|nr:trimeric intracellular cation channel family protein [Agaricicola taiwanensis]GGE29681.1 membrane protein [Agaricicola taiwanensis]
MFQLLDYLGVAVFAATGALAASRKELDIVAFIFFAAATGLGGGTLRDLLIGQPVFWIVDTHYLIVPLAAAVLIYLTAHLLESRYRALLWADAVGLASYAVMGSAKAMTAGVAAPAAIAMGIITATFGGIIRDVIAAEPSVMLRREVYVTAAFAGAATFVILVEVGSPFWIAAGCGAALAFLVRAGALLRGWMLPVYRRRPGRDPKDL